MLRDLCVSSNAIYIYTLCTYEMCFTLENFIAVFRFFSFSSCINTNCHGQQLVFQTASTFHRPINYGSKINTYTTGMHIVLWELEWKKSPHLQQTLHRLFSNLCTEAIFGSDNNFPYCLNEWKLYAPVSLYGCQKFAFPIWSIKLVKEVSTIMYACSLFIPVYFRNNSPDDGKVGTGIVRPFGMKCNLNK